MDVQTRINPHKVWKHLAYGHIGYFSYAHIFSNVQVTEQKSASMGKEKETFESWRKTIRGKKVKAPPQTSEDPKHLAGKSKKTNSLSRPQGMKSTPVSKIVEVDLRDADVDIDIAKESAGKDHEARSGMGIEKGKKGINHHAIPQ